MIRLVLIVHELGLRSTLAGRLALAGVDVVTARDFADPRLTRAGGRAAVLITDEAAVGMHPGGVDALAQDARWRGVVLLTDRAMPAAPHPRLVHVRPQAAASTIEALIEGWRNPG